MRLMVVVIAVLMLCSLEQAQAQRTYVTASIVRPATGAAYTAGDIVGDTSETAIVFSSNLYSAGRITWASLETDTANTANGTFRLWLLNDTTGQGGLVDGAAFAATQALQLKVVGYIDFTLSSTGQAGGEWAGAYVGASTPLEYYASGKAGLYGRLVATGEYVPKVSEVIRIKLIIEAL